MISNTIRCAIGNDTLTGTSVADMSEALQGNDSVSGAGGIDPLRGGEANDSLVGGDGLENRRCCARV
jgi:Ca2+-binding RTX toxin-like protein